MLVVSPFSRGGYVNSDMFDHTSQLRFIEGEMVGADFFGIPGPIGRGDRVAAAEEPGEQPALGDRGVLVLVEQDHPELLPQGRADLGAGLGETRSQTHLVGEVHEVATAAGVKHLVLTHLVPGPPNFLARRIFMQGVAEAFSGEVTLGEDRMRFELAPVAGS